MMTGEIVRFKQGIRDREEQLANLDAAAGIAERLTVNEAEGTDGA